MLNHGKTDEMNKKISMYSENLKNKKNVGEMLIACHNVYMSFCVICRFEWKSCVKVNGCYSCLSSMSAIYQLFCNYHN